jgi:hypothetical protein
MRWFWRLTGTSRHIPHHLPPAPCSAAPLQPESTVSSLQTAMGLYGCTHYEWLREPQHDMNCLLAWGPDALLITFRGTQSLANIRADAKVGGIGI